MVSSPVGHHRMNVGKRAFAGEARGKTGGGPRVSAGIQLSCITLGQLDAQPSAICSTGPRPDEVDAGHGKRHAARSGKREEKAAAAEVFMNRRTPFRLPPCAGIRSFCEISQCGFIVGFTFFIPALLAQEPTSSVAEPELIGVNNYPCSASPVSG